MAPSTDPRQHQHHHQDAHIPQLKGIRHLSISQISSFHILWFLYDGLFLCRHIISDKFSFEMITAAEQLSDFSSSSSSSIRNSTSPPLSVWEWPLLRKHSCYYYYTPIHLYIPIHYTPIHLYTILRKITPGLPLTTIHLPHIPIPTSYSTCPPQPTFTLLYLPPPKRYHLPRSPPLSGLTSRSFAHIHQPLLMP